MKPVCLCVSSRHTATAAPQQVLLLLTFPTFLHILHLCVPCSSTSRAVLYGPGRPLSKIKMPKDIFPVVKESKPAAAKPSKAAAPAKTAAAPNVKQQAPSAPAPAKQAAPPAPQKKLAAPAAPAPKPVSDVTRKYETELAEAKEQVEAANTRADEALQSLRESAEREASLSDLLTMAGYSSVSLNGIDWTVESAKKLMEEEAAALSKLDSMVATARAGSERCAAMIAQQEVLQRQLSQFSQAAPVA